MNTFPLLKRNILKKLILGVNDRALNRGLRNSLSNKIIKTCWAQDHTEMWGGGNMKVIEKA